MARNGKAPPGYIGIGTHYVSQPFLFTLMAGIFVLIAVYAAILHPVAVRWWLGIQKAPEFALDSPYLAEYTGNARLVLPNGILLYEGAMEFAAAQGEGRLYKNGELIYEGSFESNEFSGYGRLYESGTLVYEGDFKHNMRNGKGKAFSLSGLVMYDGDFDSNEITGQGKWYDNGILLYSGGFTEGLYSGAGKMYRPDGRLLYDGDFLAGMYDGKGKLYRNGVLLYEGEFAAGKYNGTGTEYDTETGYPVFSGKYLDNERMKAGVSYDENGNPDIPAGEPVPKPDPLSLLGKSYSQTVSYLTSAGISIKEKAADGILLVIDEGEGVIYGFQILDDGSPDYMSRIYYYGLLSAGGVVVGADISDITGGTISKGGMSTAELLVLGYSNALWGSDATAAKSSCMVFAGYPYSVAAFYLPTELSAAKNDELLSEPHAALELSGRILFLRIDYNE